MDGRLTIRDNDVRSFLTFALRNAADHRPPVPLPQLASAWKRAKSWTLWNRLGVARRNVAHHYDISPALYDAFLDDSKQYTCAYFRRPDMTLDEAQARDWLAYAHAAALAFRQRTPALHADCSAMLRAARLRERAAVRALVAAAARRLRWVRRLPSGDGRGWRRHVAILKLAAGLMLAADVPDDNNPATDSKVIHARHH
jgi:hypothetical protein